MSTCRAWAGLTWGAKELWKEVFPDGKVPIKSIASQRVVFDGFRDPESVFCVDWDAMDFWQREAFLEKLGEGGFMKVVVERVGGVCFLFGRSQVRLLGVGEVTFWVRSEVLT